MADDSFPARPAIAASQLIQLRRLFTALLPANPFYTKKISQAGVPATVASLHEFSETFPFTTKQEIDEDQRAHPPYGTNLTFPLDRYTRFHQTSGTTGAPLRWLDTPESWSWMVESWTGIFRAANVTASDRVFFAFSFGPFIGFWLAYEAAQQIGCLCIPAGGLGSAARLRVLIDNGATILCCTPTYALRLAEVAAEEKIDLRDTRVKTIVVAGEPGGSIPALRVRLEKLWGGARVFDHHGMTETGPVTHECPDQPGVLHVLEPAYFAEVIDPASGKPVESGQKGELVLTTLGRIGSPLLRYRTGDLVKRGTRNAERGSPCTCSRHTLTLEGGILGRVDDMIVVRGVNIFPGAVEDIMRVCGDVAEYRVMVSHAHALTELSVQIEPVPGCADSLALASRLERAFQDAFTLRVPVKPVPPGTLPRFEMKAKRWLNQS
ncbi:MAG: phenylacetate--CoA ligase [Verrucomicrobia bacterium]|nr:MAG: phenylacetate--CoA ligase [Verrucomicrobiota bacterium]